MQKVHHQTHNMLVNFALECLGTEVTSDRVSRDGYEPRNLLRSGGMLWNGRGGFLAECFIKPPVILTFKFACPVYLKSIVIDPKVGTQRSSVIEIYTATDGRVTRLVPASIAPKGNRADVPQTSSEPVFKKIGFVRLLEPGQVYFFNPRFNLYPAANGPSPESFQHRPELYHHQAAMLMAVDSLAVRIVGTATSSVAAIGKLEIWGVPARSCSPQLKQDVIQKYTSAVCSPGCSGSSVNHRATNCKDENMKHMHLKTQNGYNGGHKQNESSQNLSKTQCSNGHASTTSQNPEPPSAVQIPNEFLDALTCEIMSMPMLLPSGQCVDMSSLDKFSEVEANYGRHPSDPFTGLNFTATRKPVVNAALKVSIDHFMMKHADDPSLHSLPRALGHGSKPPDSTDVHDGHSPGDTQSSRGSSLSRSEGNLKRAAEDRLQPIPQTLLRPSSPAYATSQHSLSGSTSAPAHKRFKKEAGASVNQTGARSVSSEVQTSQPVAGCSAESHEERLRSSLRESMASVLGQLPVFSCPTSQQSAPCAEVCPSDEHCSKCQTKLKQNDPVFKPREPMVVYKFPCRHLVCRTCVINAGSGVSTSSVMCSVCRKLFSRGELVRTHV